MHEYLFRIAAEERMRDIQREAAHQRLVHEAQGQRRRFRFSLRWLRLPGRIIGQRESRSPVRFWMRGYK